MGSKTSKTSNKVFDYTEKIAYIGSDDVQSYDGNGSTSIAHLPLSNKNATRMLKMGNGYVVWSQLDKISYRIGYFNMHWKRIKWVDVKTTINIQWHIEKFREYDNINLIFNSIAYKNVKINRNRCKRVI